jgi:DNA-binding response OmpR family regulator
MGKRAPDIALLDGDPRHARRLLRGLREQGARAAWFADADALLLSQQPYGFRFFLVDLSLDRGGRLIRLLRRRSDAGNVAFGVPDAGAGLRIALSAGADMFLTEPLEGLDVALALQAVRRRMEPAAGREAWQLDPRSRRLIAPGGRVAELSESDARMLGCFAASDGSVVKPGALAMALGRGPSDAADNLMHAAIYRLRRRVERACEQPLPLRSVNGVGYLFRGRLGRLSIRTDRNGP